MITTMFSTFCLLFCVANEIVARTNSPRDGAKLEDENITGKRPLYNISSEYPKHFSDLYPESYIPVDNNSVDYSSNDIKLMFSNKTNTNETDVTAYNNQINGSDSVYLEISLQDCVDLTHVYHVTGRQGVLLFSFTPTNNSQTLSDLKCSIELEVPPKMVAYVQVLNKSPSEMKYRVKLLDEDNTVMFDGHDNDLPEEFLTYSSKLKLYMEMKWSIHDCELYLNFTAIPEANLPHLVVNFTSPTTGKKTKGPN